MRRRALFSNTLRSRGGERSSCLSGEVGGTLRRRSANDSSLQCAAFHSIMIVEGDFVTGCGCLCLSANDRAPSILLLLINHGPCARGPNNDAAANR
jgi:hypothetical protein